jgi:vancomycin resistance protein VanJ
MVVLTLIGGVAPQRAGPMALLAVVAPYAHGLLVLLLIPLAVLRRDAVLAAVVTAAATVAALTYAPPDPMPASAGAPHVVLLTWNLHGEPAGEVGLAAALERWDPDVVVLQEAGADAAATLAEHLEVMAHPEAATPPGMVLASRLPMVTSGELDEPASAWDRPRAFWLDLDVGGASWTLVGVHLSFPMPIDSLPCPYCPERRDAQIGAVAAFAAERIQAGRHVVLAGDFNLTDREVAYGALTGGELRDAARDLTWRPLGIRWLPPLLRLDYVLIGPGIGLVDTETDCAISGSDHCPVLVELRGS